MANKSRFEFLLWGREPAILYQSIKIPNLSHYKMMVLNPQRITENDNMILLQNEDWFLSWGYLKGKFHHYKMTIGFYHQVTWRGHSATTKWRLVFICFYHQVAWRENFNTTKWRLEMIGKYEIRFSHVAFRRAAYPATKWDWVFTCCLPMGKFPCYKMTFDF